MDSLVQDRRQPEGGRPPSEVSGRREAGQAQPCRLPPSTRCARRRKAGLDLASESRSRQPHLRPLARTRSGTRRGSPRQERAPSPCRTRENPGEKAPGHPSSCRGACPVATVLRPAASTVDVSVRPRSRPRVSRDAAPRQSDSGRRLLAARQVVRSGWVACASRPNRAVNDWR